MLYERTEGGEIEADAFAQLAWFETESERALELLAAILPEAQALSDTDTLTYLHGTISERRHAVAVPAVPTHLDAVLCDTPLLGGVEPKLGNGHLRILTVLGFPNTTTPGLLDTLNDLGFSYRWTTRWIALDKAQANKHFTKLRRQWFSKRKSIGAVLREALFNRETALVDPDAEAKAAETQDALQELGSDDVAFGYLTTTIVVADPDPKRANEKILAVERIVNGRGFVTIRETMNAVEAWLGSLPGNPYANVRQPIVHTLNVAHMMPVSAVWAGPEANRHLDAPPMMLTETRGSTPFRLDLHVGDVGHTLVVGPTGAGKSVVLSLLALQFRRFIGAQVVIFDRGHSARAATLAMTGTPIELGLDGALALQPLARIDEPGEMAFALEWVTGLLSNEGMKITPDVKDAIWTALQSLASAPKPERTLTGFGGARAVRGHRRGTGALQARRRLWPAARWRRRDLGARRRGAYRDGGADAAQGAGAAGADLPVPSARGALHRATDPADPGRGLDLPRRSVVRSPDPRLAEDAAQKERAVVFATQSLADIERSSIAPALIESCPTRIFLPNDRALEPQARTVYARFGLNDRQVEILATATPKRDYYAQTARGNRLFELRLGPIALALCGAGSPDDPRLIDRTIAKSDPAEFADAFLRAKGLPWAADLLGAFPGKPAAPPTKPTASPLVVAAPSPPATQVPISLRPVAPNLGIDDLLPERFSPYRVSPKPNRAARRKATRNIATAVALSALAAIAVPRPAIALTVFDPLNYQENMLSAVRAMEQINNQVRQLQNDAQALLRMDQNLQRLGATISPDLQRSLADIQARLREGEDLPSSYARPRPATPSSIRMKPHPCRHQTTNCALPRIAGTRNMRASSDPHFCRGRSSMVSAATAGCSATP